MKILSDEKMQVIAGETNRTPSLDKFLVSKNITAFRAIAQAQHKDTLRQVRELLDGIENPYRGGDDTWPTRRGARRVAFKEAIQSIKALLEANSKNAEKRHCSECNWEGLENETGFGHNDFYCPICLRETLDIQFINKR